MTGTRVFRARGVNDEVTICQCCSRTDLKRTVALEVLDPDGNGTGEILRFGTDCAARAAGWTQADLRRRVREVEEAERAARSAEWHRKQDEELERWQAFVLGATGAPTLIEGIQALGGFTEARAAYKAQCTSPSP